MTSRRSKGSVAKWWGAPIVTVVAVSLATTSLAVAQPAEPDRNTDRELPPTVLDLKLDAPVAADGLTAGVARPVPRRPPPARPG
jgi:hypothetical protein